MHLQHVGGFRDRSLTPPTSICNCRLEPMVGLGPVTLLGAGRRLHFPMATLRLPVLVRMHARALGPRPIKARQRPITTARRSAAGAA